MDIEYKYTIASVDANARCMEVVYEAEGHQTMHIGARLPFEGESLDDVIRQFAPLAYWSEQQRPVVAPTVGLSGTLAPIPVVEPQEPSAEDRVFVAIFPTPATGAIGATVFE